MDRFKLSIIIIGFIISVLFSIQAMMNVKPRSLRDTNINLLEAVRKELSSSVLQEMRFNLHYKCWAYRAEFTTESSVGLNESEISKLAIQTLQAFSRVFERSVVNKELYYDPSDLYLYEGRLYDKNSKLHVFI